MVTVQDTRTTSTFAAHSDGGPGSGHARRALSRRPLARVTYFSAECPIGSCLAENDVKRGETPCPPSQQLARRAEP